MNEDRVIGTAVLDVANRGLLITCGSHSRGVCQFDRIPIYEPAVGQKEESPQWAIVRNGSRLNVSPSVLIYLPATKESPRKDLFHNGGSWSVAYVEFDPAKYAKPYDHWREVNKEVIAAWERGERNMP